MKTRYTLYIVLSLAAVGFILASCAKEMPEGAAPVPGGNAPGMEIRVRAEVPSEKEGASAASAEGGTRTYIDDNAILWQTGDRMKLAITPLGGSPVLYTSNGLESTYDGQASATFSFALNPIPTVAESYLYQGVQPASAVADAGDLTACKVVLPAVQNASGSAYDPAAFILVAEPQSQTRVEDWTVSFRRAVALNELTLKNLPDGVVRVEIVAPEGVNLAGGRNVNLTTGASGAIYSGTRTVEINYDTPLSEGDNVIRFTSWGATVAVGEKLTVLAYTDTKSYTRAITLPASHPITFVENKLNQVTVDMASATETTRYFSGGNGTADSPWRIASTTDLGNLASYISIAAEDAARKAALEDDYYLQTADINFNNGYLEAIGNSNASPYSYFKGTYLGGGYKVSNAKIRNQQSSKAVGFFGYLAGSAHIDGLCLYNASITSTTWNNGTIVGCIQGGSSVIVENCVVTGSSVSSNNTGNGGLVGKIMSGVIRNSSYSGTVTSSRATEGSSNPKYAVWVGGIAGTMNTGGLISNCHGKGVTVTCPNGSCAGGILGGIESSSSATNSKIEHCTVDGSSSVSADKGYVGGIVGISWGQKGIVNHCSASCNVSSTNTGGYGWVGGIAGCIYGVSDFLIANCCYTGGTLSSAGTSGCVAGIVGDIEPNSNTLGNLTVFNCCAFPTRVSTGSSNANIAGIAGMVNTATIRNCYCPTPASEFYFNGSASGNSRGSIYGWLRGKATTDPCSGQMLDVYWLSGWKAGNFNGSYTYVKSEQALTDAQMQNTGSVTRPSTGVSYGNFIGALNADVAAWNASPLFSISGVTWVMGTDGYPVPSGTALAPAN